MQEETTTTGTAIAEYSKTEAALSGLREKYEDKTYDVATKPGMVEANAARGELRGWIKKLETTRVEIKAPALDRCRDIDKEAHRIEAELRALEGPIHAQIKEETGRVKREKEAAEKAEAERVDAIKARIEEVERLPLGMVGCTAEEIAVAEKSLGDISFFHDTCGEFTDQAQAVHTESARKLHDLHTAAVNEEQGRAELSRLRAEQDERDKKEQARAVEEIRQRAEAAEESGRRIAAAEKASRERIEQEQREANEAQEKAEAEAREKRLAEEQKAKDERDRVEADDRKRRESAEADERAARQRFEAEVREARERREAEEAKIEAAERESRERIEKEEREAREKREVEEAKIKANRAAEEEQLQTERDEIDAERERMEAISLADALAKDEAERKDREEAEAVERDKQRAVDNLLDAHAMLSAFIGRFGDDERFVGIVAAINEYIKDNPL